MRYHTQSVNIGHAGVDWLTCTAKTKSGAEGLWAVAERVLSWAKLEGENPTRWHGHGYSGWSVTGLSVGARSGDSLLRLSGQQAINEWRHALATAENASRFDLAVDLYFDLPVTSLAVKLYRDVGHAPSRNGRPPTRTLIRDSDHGQTVYIGRRVSENMGRLYDKGVESATNPPGTRWRYEVEYKGDSAWNAVLGLLPAQEEAQAVSSSVAQWFGSRGGRVWRTESSLALRKCQPKETSTDRQLSWLARGVRPTVMALIDQLGYDRVATALGIGARSGTP